MFPFLEPYMDPSLKWLGNTSEQSGHQKAAIAKKLSKQRKHKGGKKK